MGDHYTSCMRTGRVQARARPVEKAWEKVRREAGASTHFQKLLRQKTLANFLERPAFDQRRIDVLANDLPFSTVVQYSVTPRSDRH